MPNPAETQFTFDKFKALAEQARSQAEAQPKQPIATIQLSWPAVATRLAVSAIQIYFSNNPTHTETTDEFAIRGALRPILTSMLSEGFVTFKEHPYTPGSADTPRFDVLLAATKAAGGHLAWIELKSDRAKVEELKQDWSKLKQANTKARKLSIYAGILTKKEFTAFEGCYTQIKARSDPSLDYVTAVNQQSIEFESLRPDPSDKSGMTRERLYAVAYIFAIATQNTDIVFNVYDDWIAPAAA